MNEVRERAEAAGVPDKAADLAERAAGSAQEARGKAMSRAQDEIDRRSTQAGEQVTGLADVMRKVGQQLDEQGNDAHARYAHQAADRMERLGGYLRDSDGSSLLADLEDLGRRQPAAAAAAGLILGVVAARFLKASSGRRYEARYPTGDWRDAQWPTPATPPAWDDRTRTGAQFPQQASSALAGRPD